MQKNTHSVLSSNWMISDQSENQLIPFLLNILQSKSNSELSLSPTKFLSASSLGEINPFETSKPSTDKVVGVIQVHHPIFKYDQTCGPKGTQTIKSILQKWSEDDSVAAVVMDYNSGGGQASGTREISQYIFNYPKPVVSFTNDIVGSAALYMYAAGKYRMVSQYADFIGCIGSMYKSINLEGAIEKAGGKVIEVYSDLSPEKNFQSRELKNGNDRPLIEKILNPNAEEFHNDMKMFLPNITEKALKGDIFSPAEAIQEGLADSIGTLQDAIDKAFELSKNSNSKQNSNINNNMSTTKKLPRVEAVLGLESPLAITENGSFLNEEQLDTIEGRLETLEGENSTLTEQLSNDAEAHQSALTALQNQFDATTTSLTSVETTIDASLTAAGIPVEGSVSEKMSALLVFATEKGKTDGAAHTNTKTDANADTGKTFEFVDSGAAHNQIANSIKN